MFFFLLGVSILFISLYLFVKAFINLSKSIFYKVFDVDEKYIMFKANLNNNFKKGI